MKIYVCIKQVPNTNEVRIDKERGTLIRENCENIINPADKNALEEALKIKEVYKDVEITVISMGPPQALDAIKEAVSMGADSGILISDKKFSGSDTYATSYILSEAIKKIGKPDLILTGKQAVDGETAQVGPQLAQKLDYEFETCVTSINFKEKTLIIQKETDFSSIDIKMRLPCLLTISKDINEPRIMNLFDIMNLKNKKIEIMRADDIKLYENSCALDESPTKVVETYIPSKNKECIILKENYE